MNFLLDHTRIMLWGIHIMSRIRITVIHHKHTVVGCCVCSSSRHPSSKPTSLVDAVHDHTVL